MTNIVMKNVDARDESRTKEPMEILEDALSLCKFGKFHIRLLAATLCSTVAAMLVTTTSSLFQTVAECDLNMNLMQKGLLNSMPFLGHIGASMFAGFIIDAFGRRISLVGGNASLFIFNIIEASSQTYWMLLFTKLLEGISTSLCYSAISTNLSELCHIGVRDKLLMIYSSFSSLGQIIASLMALALLPVQLNYTIWRGYFEIHSWNIYLYVCSLWSLFGFILHLTIPESPKYLLTHAKEEEALEVLKSIYSENTGNKKDTFPVLSLNATGILKASNNLSIKKQIVNGLFEVKQLFRRPLVFNLLLFSIISFAGLISFTSLRVWYPQISTIIENYNNEHKDTARFCVMIDDYMQNLKPPTTSPNETKSDECIPVLSGRETYLNGAMMGLSSLVIVGVIGFLVEYFGQKVLMFVIFILSAGFSIALYWTDDSLEIAVLVSITCSLLLTSICLQQNIYVRYFPTTLRASAVSVICVIGRLGSLAGNMVFPILMKMGCMAPFIAIAAVSLGIASLVFFLPNVNQEKESGDK